jgi:hypothetical protein
VTFDEFPDAKFPLRNRSVEGGRGQDTESPGDWKNSPDKFHKFRESNEKIPSCAGPTLGPKVNKKIKRKKNIGQRGAELIRRSVKWETIKSQQGKERNEKKLGE